MSGPATAPAPYPWLTDDEIDELVAGWVDPERRASMDLRIAVYLVALRTRLPERFTRAQSAA